MKSSGADIAYCLWTHGVDAATPVSNPDLYTDLDRVFQIPYRAFARRLQQARQSGRCTDTSANFIKTRDLLLSAEIYGNTLMAEPYLPGQEITISVFADGTSLPIVERFAQKDGVAPYNGDVPVTQNSRTVIEKAAGSYNYYM